MSIPTIDTDRQTQPGDRFKLAGGTSYQLPRGGTSDGNWTKSTLKQIRDIKGAYLYQNATFDTATHKAEGVEMIEQDGEFVGITDKVVPIPAAELDSLLAEVKVTAVTTLKQTRRTALELWSGNGGVSAVYTENFQAATAYAAEDAAYRTKDGRTPEAYLIRLGSLMGMTTQEFCDYILWENSTNASPRMAQVEERYLALCYAGDATNSITPIDDLATEVEVQQALTDYQSFCDTLWAETSPTFNRPEE